MKKMYALALVAAMFLHAHAQGQSAPAQGLLNFEIYGGPSQSYFKADIKNSSTDLSLFSPIDVHFGINVLTRVNEAWQISLQAEHLRRPVSSKETPRSGSSFFRKSSIFNNQFWNYSLGARYNVYKGNKAFFFQPSAGIAVNRVFHRAFTGGRPSTKTSLALRAEAGVKFYNRRSNYFVLGIRHQQGLNNFDKQNYPGSDTDALNVDFRSKGSFTGLFVGYGINAVKRKR